MTMDMNSCTLRKTMHSSAISDYSPGMHYSFKHESCIECSQESSNSKTFMLEVSSHDYRPIAIYASAFSAAFRAFAPLSFGAGVSFFSLWLSLIALARATASLRRSGLYPFLVVLLTTLRYTFRLPVDEENDVELLARAGL